MKRIYFIIICFAIVLCYISCKTLYGIKPQKSVSPEQINNFYLQLPLKEFKKATVDSTFLFRMKKTYAKDTAQLRYHLQPLQALYFDSDENLISFHVNCNAGGFPNLQWNRNNVFNKFPPATQTKVDNLFELQEFKKLVHLNEEKNSYDYSIVIFWNFFLEKQSRRLIDQVLDNVKLTNKKINLIFVNNDNLFLEK